jgi:biotin transporter BioY
MNRTHALARCVLIVGDLAAFLLFTYYGKRAHGLPADAAGILATAAPFLLGWLAAALLLGVYRPHRYERPGKLILITVAAWTVAAPIGLIIRALWLGTPITLMFAVVAYGLMLMFLLGWRIPFGFVHTLIRRRNTPH